MDLADLKDYFIPSCFAKRGGVRLLSDLPGVCDPLIWEFYANAILRDEVIDYWVRDHEFTIEVEDIDEILGFEDVEHDFTHFKDKMLSIETIQSQHNCFPTRFEMSYLHHGVQPTSSKEDDHHQQCKSHLPHGTSREYLH